MSRLPWGPQWSGPAYRQGPSAVPSDVSAADVLRYEIEELGNRINFDMSRIGELEAIPGNRLVWVTKTPQEAERYAGSPKHIRAISLRGDLDVRKVNLPRESQIIATDQEGGYLVVTSRRSRND